MTHDREKTVAEVVTEVGHRAEGADGLIGILYDTGVTDAEELIELVLLADDKLDAAPWQEIERK
jgi:hypothetical protein